MANPVWTLVEEGLTLAVTNKEEKDGYCYGKQYSVLLKYLKCHLSLWFMKIRCRVARRCSKTAQVALGGTFSVLVFIEGR